MQKKIISYTCDNIELKGHLIHHPDILEKRPGILIAHAWKGIDDYILDKANRMAELGYVVFAADVYGKEKHPTTNEEAFACLLPLFLDRALLQRRIRAGLDVLKQQPLVDPNRLGAMGFCFGGLTTIELFRSGAPIKGAISFHGLLGDKIGEHTATVPPISPDIKGSILVLHGHDDPLVSTQDIANFQKEMTDHKVDWQFHAYGHTSHAFTNQEAHDTQMGLIYNERADIRSWQAMQNFFAEVL